MLALLCLAFALRTYRLDFQSLWSDEGISLQRASLPPAAMLAEMPVEHTPGYFLLLHGWRNLTGDQDFALRYLSVLASVLAVALVYRLAVDLGGGRLDTRLTLPALAAAALMATGAIQLWYAQEARMYAWLLATSLLSTWALWRMLAWPGRRANGWAVLYALATAAMVYLHFYGALVPVAQAIFVVGWLLATRDGPTFLRWLAASGGALLLFAPWLPRALAIFGFTGWREGGNAAEIPWRYLAAYTAGEAMPAPWAAWLPWLYLLLAAGGIFFWWRRRPAAAWLLVTWLLAPWLAVLALAARNPDFHERYTLFLTAPLLLLAAGGIGLLHPAVWRRRGAETAASRLPAYAAGGAAALLLLLVAANLAAVQRHYTDTALHKPDFRGAAARISAELQPGDVVLVDGPDPEKVFLHYYKGDAPVFAVSSMEEAPLAEVDGTLREMTQGARRAWELLYFHNPAAVQVWLATQGWATEPTGHNGIRVSLYALGGGTPVTRTLAVAFGPALTLAQADVSTLAPAPGDLLRVSTHWAVHAPAPEYKFSLRLANHAGEVVQSVDYVPQNWFAPTSVWFVGQPAADQRGLLLPADLPPGAYRLTLRLYDPATGAAVETAAGQDVTLAELTVGG